MYNLIRTCADGEFNPDSLGNEHRRAVLLVKQLIFNINL